MKVDKHELLAGVPAKRLRDTLVRMARTLWSAKAFEEELGLPPNKTASIVAGLLAEEYIEPGNYYKEGWYQIGRAGQRLIQVKFIKRINRAKANALVESLLDRARQINAGDDYVLKVTELKLFGSLVDPSAQDFGDIDVSVNTGVKPEYMSYDTMDLPQLTREYFPKINVRSYLDYLYLPERVVLSRLKNRSPYISLHSICDMRRIGVTGTSILDET